MTAASRTPATSVTPAATFPLRPPTWVRIWVTTLGVVAAAVGVGFGVPLAASGHVALLLPVAVVVVVAGLLAWRVGGLLAAPTPDGRLVVRNRTRTHVLTPADVERVEAGAHGNRAGTPLAVLVLTDGTEVTVDATLAPAFQSAQLDAAVAALRSWHQHG